MTSATIDAWSGAWAGRGFRAALSVTLGILIATLAGFRTFLDFVESRPGVGLNDPILSIIPPVDLTWLTFMLIYGGLLTGIVVLSRHPDLLLRTIQAYIVMIIIRIVCMYAIPLDPPPESIPLVDPLVEMFGATGATLTRDLFFSGHTATLCLLGLSMPTRAWRIALFAATGGVALCVLWQHVHYTIDVVVAPLAAYTSYRIAGLPIFRQRETIH